MLDVFRQKFTGWVALAILGTIGLSFVFVGLDYNFSGQAYAAKVDGEPIGIGQFEAAYRDELQATPQYANLPENLRATVRRNLLERLIQQRVIDNYLAEAGYRISPQQLAEQIHAIPDFQVDGVFDRDLYRSALDAAGRDVAEYEQSVMLTLQRMQLQRGIRGSSIVTPGAYRRYLNLAFEQRIVSTADIDRSAVSDEVVVTDEMIAAYYDENPALYQTPETADVEYVELLRSEISSQVSINESQLRDYYEDSKSRFEQDEQRRARHILILFDDDEDAAVAQANDGIGPASKRRIVRRAGSGILAGRWHGTEWRRPRRFDPDAVAR